MSFQGPISSASSHLGWWSITCITPIPLPMLPMSTTKLPPWDSLDRTPAITAGSIQYFRPTTLIMGWYLRRYGLSLSASLSEARTPGTHTEGSMWLGVLRLRLRPVTENPKFKPLVATSWPHSLRPFLWSKIKTPCMHLLKLEISVVISAMSQALSLPWQSCGHKNHWSNPKNPSKGFSKKYIMPLQQVTVWRRKTPYPSVRDFRQVPLDNFAHNHPNF